MRVMRERQLSDYRSAPRSIPFLSARYLLISCNNENSRHRPRISALVQPLVIDCERSLLSIFREKSPTKQLQSNACSNFELYLRSFHSKSNVPLTLFSDLTLTSQSCVRLILRLFDSWFLHVHRYSRLRFQIWINKCLYSVGKFARSILHEPKKFVKSIKKKKKKSTIEERSSSGLRVVFVGCANMQNRVRVRVRRMCTLSLRAYRPAEISNHELE